MKFSSSAVLGVALVSGFACPAWAAGAGNTAAQAASQPAPVQIEWDARVRHESVDDSGYARDARADTLRLRLGLSAELGNGWSTLLEGAGLVSADDHYNSGANGHASYPVISDPQSSELNQLWLRWARQDVAITLGRQRIIVDNQRWVGNVGWRQLEQTYDALASEWRPADGWLLRYDWFDRVHRVSGPDALNPLARARALNTHILNVSRATATQKWIGYAYLHEDRDVAALSSATVGMRWVGDEAKQGNGPGWAVEVARQRDYANNPTSYSLAYWLLEPSWTINGTTARLGWEHLGSNASVAVQTPLATLHLFNGWDDRFLTTPSGGLDDRYLMFNGALSRSGPGAHLAWTVRYHDFRAVHGGRYGSEWDAALGFPVAAGIHGLLKMARYRADGFGNDDTKLWLQFEWQGRHAL